MRCAGSLWQVCLSEDSEGVRPLLRGSVKQRSQSSGSIGLGVLSQGSRSLCPGRPLVKVLGQVRCSAHGGLGKTRCFSTGAGYRLGQVPLH